MDGTRNWTVLFIGGASGTGKSSLAYDIGKYYGVNVIEVDDLYVAVKAATSKEQFPAIHYWDEGLDWKTIGIEANVDWLQAVSKEMNEILKELVERHLEDQLPVIIEGDFISPEIMINFPRPSVQAVFLMEENQNQIIQNYLSREGGEMQHYRAAVSVAYGRCIAEKCQSLGIGVLEARPWKTALDRAIEILE